MLSISSGSSPSRLAAVFFLALLSSALAAEPSRVDLYGDPLPAGAAVRLGTVRYGGLNGWSLPLFIAGDERLITVDDRRLLVMEAVTGKWVREIDIGDQSISAISLAPDRRTVFTLGSERSEANALNMHAVSQWDLQSGELLRTLRFNEQRGCDHFAITPDGDTVLTSTGGGTIRVWNFADGREILSYKLDPRRIDALALSPDGKLLAVSASKSVLFWEWGSGNAAERIEVGRPVQSLAFSPDGSILAEGPDMRPEIVLRDVKTRQVLRTLSDAEKNWMIPSGLAFSADSRSLAAVNSIGLRGKTIPFRVHVWDVATGTIQHQFSTGVVHPAKVSFSADGHWLAASVESSNHVWDLRRGRLMGAERPVHVGAVFSVHLSNDGSVAVTAGHDGTVRVWDATTGKQRHAMQHGYWVRATALSPGDRLIASSSLDDTVRLWDAATGKELFKFPGHGDLGGTRAVAFSADGGRFASWGDDFYLRIWDTRTGKALAESRVHPPDVQLPELEAEEDRGDDYRLVVGKAVFSPDGRSLLVVHGQSIFTFDAAGGRLLSRMTHADAILISLALSPDGKRIATSHWGNPIQTKLADGTVKVSATRSHTVRVIDIAAEEELFAVPLPAGGAGPLAFSPDSKLLAVASVRSHAGIRLLDATTGEEREAIEGIPSQALAICFSGDSRRLACGFGDGTALVWDIALEER